MFLNNDSHPLIDVLEPFCSEFQAFNLVQPVDQQQLWSCLSFVLQFIRPHVTPKRIIDIDSLTRLDTEMVPFESLFWQPSDFKAFQESMRQFHVKYLVDYISMIMNRHPHRYGKPELSITFGGMVFGSVDLYGPFSFDLFEEQFDSDRVGNKGAFSFDRFEEKFGSDGIGNKGAFSFDRFEE
jgi:hypothetical protein